MGMGFGKYCGMENQQSRTPRACSSDLRCQNNFPGEIDNKNLQSFFRRKIFCFSARVLRKVETIKKNLNKIRYKNYGT